MRDNEKSRLKIYKVTTMSSLSRCTAAGRTPKALPIKTLVEVIMIFAVIMTFGIAHLYLRFSLNAVQTETNYLQSLQGTLQSEVKALQGKTEALKRPERLFEYAHLELGMVPYGTSEREMLRVPKDIFTRYEMARASQETMLASAGAPAGSRARWLEKLSERFGLISQALAGETEKK